MLLQHHVASLGSTCSVAQKNELLEQWCKLEARISAYEHKVSVIIKLNDNIWWAMQDGRTPGMDPEAGEASDDLLDLYLDEWFTPEKEQITLPSALTAGKIDHLVLKPIAMINSELRKGQVMDALGGLHLALGESPFISEWKWVAQIARGPHIEHGITFISWMLRLESVDPHTDRLGVHYNVSEMTRNTWRRFMISLMMT
jgi:hypothetical protein